MPHTDEARGLAEVALRNAGPFFATIPAAAAATAAGAWTAVPGLTTALAQRAPVFAGGQFTAPKTGWYTFSFNIYASIVTGTDLYVLLSVNGVPGGGGTTYGESYFNNATGATVAKQMAYTVTIPLNAGDTVKPYYFSGSAANSLNGHGGSFSGHQT